MKSINPATEEIIAEYEEYSEKEVESIIQKSKFAFLEWRKSTIAERKVFNYKLKDLMLKRKEELAKLITLEMGKPLKQSLYEIEKCCLVLEYYAEKADQFLSPQIVETESKKSYIRFDPLGVVLAIMPWNFPFWQVFRFSAANIVAGNSGLLKHASNVTMCALEIEKLYKEAQFPENVFRALLISGERAKELIKNEEIKAITLTGSEEAGRLVGEECGRNIKKVVLELGGSDAFIVLNDADIEDCAKWAAKSRTINNGQSCIAAKRFIVLKDVYEEFREAFVEEMKKLKVGDPMDLETDVGPLARKDLLEEVEEQVQSSIKDGARILLGGKKLEGKGYFYSPTVLENVTLKMRVFQEEVFGPVAPLIKAKDEDEAVEIANHSRYGLGASVWTRDLSKGEKIAALLDVGTVYINGIVKSDPRMPFGGVKASGYGRELSYFGIREFVNIKSIFVEK